MSTTPPAITAARYNVGKTRYDLFPWPDVVLRGGDYDPSIRETFAGLQVWFAAKPFALRLPVPERQVRGICEVLTFGAAKYAPRGWEKGLSFAETFASATRHARAYLAGEQLDLESGLAHEAHFWCNFLFLLVFTARGRTDLDDRPAADPATKDLLDRSTSALALGSATPQTTNPKESN